MKALSTPRPTRARSFLALHRRSLLFAALGLILVLGFVFWLRAPAPAQIPLVAAAGSSQANYDLTFSTYLGGSGFDQIRDVTTDSSGNIYVTGSTASLDFPTTAGAMQRKYGGGPDDAFIAKLDSTGKLLWSTYLGGKYMDYGLAIKVDSQGYIYVGGLGGPDAPTTPGSFQPDYNGVTLDHGPVNAYVAKIKPDGSGLVWASFVGPYYLIRDLDIDSDGNIYASIIHLSREPGPAPSAWFTNAPYKTPPGGPEDLAVVKIRSDGTKVIWATYFGGSGTDGGGASIKLDAAREPYVLDYTDSTDLPTTAGAVQPTNKGDKDLYLVKFNAAGSAVLFSTYFGGSATEETETHELALDKAGNAYFTVGTNSQDIVTTPGAFQRSNPATYYGVVAEISGDGTQLLASTYFSASGCITMDASGNVMICGDGSAGTVVTPDAYQPNNAGGYDMYVATLSPDLSTLLYATMLGGSGDDQGRAGWADSAGNLLLAGRTQSDDYPTKNPLQSSHRGDWDGALAMFSRVIHRYLYLPLIVR